MKSKNIMNNFYKNQIKKQQERQLKEMRGIFNGKSNKSVQGK